MSCSGFKKIIPFIATALLSSCNEKARVWDNPNDPLVIEANKRGAASTATPNADPPTSLLETLSFSRFELPSVSDAFDLNTDSDSVKVVKSAFEQTITLLRIERSKNLSEYYWRLNARKYALTQNGLTSVPGFFNPVNLFPECNDPGQGKGVSSFEITEISDKYRVPGFSADALPDNVTHIKLSVTCQSASLGPASVTRTKIISLDNLEEDTSVSLTPLANQKRIKCAWTSKKILVGSDGQLFNYQYWRGPKIPGNFSNSGSLNLGEISACSEVAGKLEIKTTGSCYTFDLSTNTLLSSACKKMAKSFGAFSFDNFHEPFLRVNDCSTEGTFYDFLAGGERHVITGKTEYRTEGYSSRNEWVFQYTKNGIKQSNVDSAQLSVLLEHTSGDGCGFWKPSASAKIGKESQFGQRIFGWSVDRKAIFLSSKIIPQAAVEERRYAPEPLDAEAAQWVTFSDPFVTNSIGQNIQNPGVIKFSLKSLLSKHIAVQFKMYTSASENDAAWESWVETANLSLPAPQEAVPVKIKFRDQSGFVSDETILGYIDSSAPSVLSIVRGVSSNPTSKGESVNYLVNFSEPVKGLTTSNFTLTDPAGAGALGSIQGVVCSLGSSQCVATIKVTEGFGRLRLDLSSILGVSDYVGRPLTNIRQGDESYSIPGWVPEAYVKAANANASDYFGRSVSLSGDAVAVGATGEDSNQTTITNGNGASSDNSASSAGAVYLYRRSGSSWAQEAYVKAANTDTSDLEDNFGYSVSLSGDTLAVGAYGEDTNQNTITNGTGVFGGGGAPSSGAVYVYRRSGGIWAQEAYVKAANANASDIFGHSVSLSGDTLAVGADGEDSNQTTITNGVGASSDNSASASGAVYVYRRSGTQWAQEAYVKAANADASDYFGHSVALSGDTLAIGAPYEDSSQTTITNGTGASSDNSASSSGAVYVYRRTGAQWAQEAYVKAANADAGDYFGYSVALSGDTLAVGAPYEDSSQTTITNGTVASIDNSVSYAGAVYVYRRGGSSWAQEAYVKAARILGYHYFGEAIAMSGDTLAVGARGDDSSQTSITNGTGSIGGGIAGSAGAVYVYRRSDSSWAREAYVKAANAGGGDYFGESVSISGDTLAVGAPDEDSNQTTITNGTGASSDNSLSYAGALYIFRNNGRLFAPHLRISSKTSSSITLAWHQNLGGSNKVKIAAAVIGAANPASCSAATAIELAAGVTSYTYSGLTSGTKYGFRVCAFDGTDASEGATIWDDTLP